MHVELKRELIKHQDFLMNYAFKLTKDIDKANDLLQETNFKILSNINKWDGTRFKAWAGTVMFKVNINIYRKECVRISKVDFIPYYHDENILTIEDKKVDLLDTMKKLKHCNSFAKKCLILYAKGYKYEEISEKLDKNINTVKSAIRSARNFLN